MNIKLSFSSSVYQQLSQQLSILDTFKGSWKAKENQEGQYLKELRKMATIESIGSSTRIEGAMLTDQEVEKLLKSVKITKLQSRKPILTSPRINQISMSVRPISFVHSITLNFGATLGEISQ